VSSDSRFVLVACLVTLLAVGAASPEAAAESSPAIAYLDIEDPYTTRKPFEGCLKQLGVRANKLKPSGAFVASGARVLLIGSFATGNAKGRRFIRENARRIRDFVLGGGVVVEFGQSSRDEQSPPWLPESLTVERCARDTRSAVVLDPDHPLLAGKTKVDLAALMGGEVFRGERYYAPSVLGGTDLFATAEGLRAVVAERKGGEFPLILTASAGKGGVILLSMSPDLLCDSGIPQSARAEAQDAMRNLLAVAVEGRLSAGGSEARSVPRGAVAKSVSVFHDRNGNRRRDSGEDGVADVVVTYDFQDVRTDGSGLASVDVDPLNPGLLFIRVPDRWEAQKWYAEAAAPGPFEFPLRSAGDGSSSGGGSPGRSGEGAGAAVVQLTDTHLGRIALDEDAEALESFVGELQSGVGKGGLFVFTGDLTHTGSLGQLLEYRSALSALGGRGLHVMGNHDWGNGPDKGRLFREALGPTHYTREWGGHLFVSVPRLETHARAASWLEQTIAQSQLPVVLLLHYFPTRRAFDALPADRVVGVLSGHWHADMVSVRNGITNINSSPSLMGGWDFSPGSARVIRLDQGGLVRADLVPMRRKPPKGKPVGKDTSELGAVWTGKVPGKVLLASPVVSGKRLLVPFRSAGTVGGDGGLCALSLDSGSTEWCVATQSGVANDLAVGGGLALVAEVDGTLHGVDVDDGTVRWSTRLDGSVKARYVEHYLHSGPVVRKGVAYFCYQGGPFGIDMSSGRIVWTGEPFGGLDAFAHSRGAIVGDHLFCGAFLGGVFRYRLGVRGVAQRERLWKGNVTADLGVRGDALSVLTREDLLALDPLSGKLEEKVRVEYSVLPAGVAWGEFGPFLSDGNRGVRRLGERSGGKAWRHGLEQGELSFALNLRDSAGLVGSPVALKRHVLVPGSDGLLRLLSARSGVESARFVAGGPLVSSPVVHSGTVYVADYFGSVSAIPLSK
jgi:outer membrane protein assembly factor BamB